uniref:DUF834 domain-containing protein n=1 Tax=Oryza meridionalis TaxID=40149 RepID=A0A0E0CIR6_9ORYZ
MDEDAAENTPVPAPCLCSTIAGGGDDGGVEVGLHQVDDVLAELHQAEGLVDDRSRSRRRRRRRSKPHFEHGEMSIFSWGTEKVGIRSGCQSRQRGVTEARKALAPGQYPIGEAGEDDGVDWQRRRRTAYGRAEDRSPARGDEAGIPAWRELG